MVSGLSLSPEFNPLSLFIKEDSYGITEREGLRKSSFEQDVGGLVPDQRPSIVNESATVRYYKDPSKRPLIVSEGHQGTAREQDVRDVLNHEDIFDVSLALDVTTGCGGKIWPAAEVLGQYIASKRSHGEWKGKSAVELGAGTGLVGFLAAEATQLDRVWITDQIPMMALMRRNLELNSKLRDRCLIGELNWGQELPHDIPAQPDILLLADCVYLEVAFQPLVDTLREMATEATEILFCYQQRRKADKRFFKLLRKHFTFHDIEDDDQTRRTEYNRQGTRLYRVIKVKK
ncbi:hypothetical protein CBS101457_002578 [Exobasidium rhododendri]|nr:hypothetical protein CBS101457_002578 [Exobasidium rhododendri]